MTSTPYGTYSMTYVVKTHLYGWAKEVYDGYDPFNTGSYRILDYYGAREALDFLED